MALPPLETDTHTYLHAHTHARTRTHSPNWSMASMAFPAL